jgi:hypothetical protein
MKRTRKTASDSGSAAIEFLVFGLVAQLVITGFGLELLKEQRAQIVSQSLARQVVRLVIANPVSAGGRVQDLLAVTAENQGKAVDEFKVSWSPVVPQVGDWVVAQASVAGQTQFATMRAGK